MGEEPIITIKNLWWRYINRNEWALKNISLEIRKGEFIAIVGPNESGKTTLVMTMNGLIPNNYRGIMKGDVIVAGMNTKEHSTGEISRKVGFVFSDPESQFLTMTVEEEIAFGLENLGLPIDEIERRIKWAMKIAGLSEELLEKPPYELSGGQKQRVAIAAVIAMRPEVIILDEPTSMLDPVGKTEVLNVLKELKRSYNATIIVVEHRLEDIASLADRTILVYNGEIIKDAPTKEFFDDIPFLLKHYVFPPEAMIYIHELRTRGLYNGYIPLTFSEAVDAVKKVLRSYHIKSQSPASPYYNTIEGRNSNAKNDVAIKIENLDFVYPDGTIALVNINLEIRNGEFIAFIGQNGSGKTTLAKNIAGLLKPTRGRVLVYGLDTKKASIHELATNVGYVFQNPDHQLFNMTVYDEIAFGPRNLMLSEDEVEKRVKESIKIVGLSEELLQESPFFLPKGLRQRIAIASILALRPKTIIVDEPTTGQDFKQSIEIMDFLKHLNKLGHTIIIITHEMEIVAKYANRVVVMADGKKILDAPTRIAFTKTDILKKAFVKPPQITRLAQSLREYGFRPDVLSVEEMIEETLRIIMHR